MLHKWKAFNKQSINTSSTSISSSQESSTGMSSLFFSERERESMTNLNFSDINHYKVDFSERRDRSRPPSIVLVPSNLSSSQDSMSSIEEDSFVDEEKNLSQILRVIMPLETMSRPLLLLAQEEDKKHLSPIHCFVRNNIEVFTATTQSVLEPAPGRKKKIDIGCVGLRCLHCGIQPPNQRVKRAVAFPSSIAKIYSTVSDMKVDHFEQCKFMPFHLKEEFQILKLNKIKERKEEYRNAKVSGSMSQYYLKSAVRMGMKDDRINGGVRIENGDAYNSILASMKDIINRKRVSCYPNLIDEEMKNPVTISNSSAIFNDND